MKRYLIAALIALGIVPATAGACSCTGPGDPREEVQQAEAALFGEVTAVEPGGKGRFGRLTEYRFTVTTDYKGNLGETVVVSSFAGGSATCGLSLGVGDRAALILYREDGGWQANSCTQRARAHLDKGLSPLPEPDGQAPARFVLGGAFGTPRIAAVDGRGRVVGYGEGDASVVDLAPCPGGEVVLELVAGDPAGDLELARRNLAGFTVGTGVALDSRRYVEHMVCLDPEGTQASLLDEAGRLLFVDGPRVRTVARGLQAATLAGDRAYGRDAIVDVRTGASTPFGPLAPGAVPLALSPDGRTLAVGGEGEPVRLVDARSAKVRATHRSLGYEALWLDDGALVVDSYRRHRFFDLDLDVARKRSSSFGPRTVHEGRLVVVRDGFLVRFDARGRRVGPRLELFTSAVQSLCGLP